MGLGRFGGGLGVAQWFIRQGANVLITDLASADEFEEQLVELRTHSNVTLVLGEHRIEDFANADLVVVNPAVQRPWENKYIQCAWENGIQVTTEMELVVRQIDKEQIIGVTGTAGKSTTVSMIHSALLASGIRSHLGGNIGGSILSSIDSIEKTDVVVLELSSAMLWWLDRLGGWSPHVAVITTIEENHLDWHGSFEEYSRCKKCLFEHQTSDDVALTQDPESTFAELTVLGMHNERNAAIAFLAAISMGADATKARNAIQSFSGLPHRLQKVADGFYNDSKSTTPTATKLAVDAFAVASSVHLIVGGYDKKVDLSLLAKQSERVARLYAIGNTADEIVKQSQGDALLCETLEVAVDTALKGMQEGDVLVLSPGCASWDQFENYEERGELFCSLVSCASHQQVH